VKEKNKTNVMDKKIIHPHKDKDILDHFKRMNEDRETPGSDLYEQEMESAELWRDHYEEQRERIDWHNQ
jgi:hypothetical protein